MKLALQTGRRAGAHAARGKARTVITFSPVAGFQQGAQIPKGSHFLRSEATRAGHAAWPVYSQVSDQACSNKGKKAYGRPRVR